MIGWLVRFENGIAQMRMSKSFHITYLPWTRRSSQLSVQQVYGRTDLFWIGSLTKGENGIARARPMSKSLHMTYGQFAPDTSVNVIGRYPPLANEIDSIGRRRKAERTPTSSAPR